MVSTCQIYFCDSTILKEFILKSNWPITDETTYITAEWTAHNPTVWIGLVFPHLIALK